MMQPDRNSIDELRKIYVQLIHQPLVQRAKGVPFGKVSGPGAFITSVVLLIVSIVVILFRQFFLSLSGGQFKIYALIFFIVVVAAFFILPKYIYDERLRTRRYARKRYPDAYQALMRLEEPKKDILAAGFPVLHIESKQYFLGVYVGKQKRDRRPNVTFTGYAVVDDAGRVVTDPETFEKAFSTYDTGLVGAVNTQVLDARQWRAIQKLLNDNIPRAERFLSTQRPYFEQVKCLSIWQDLLGRLPMLYAAGKDALTIFEGRENIRRSIGYSFGLEYFYEDALFEKKMNRTFSQYMVAAHHAQLDMIRLISARLKKSVEEYSDRVRNRPVEKALTQIWSFALALSALIERMAVEGLTTDNHLQLFQKKLSYARALVPVAPTEDSDRPERLA